MNESIAQKISKKEYLNKIKGTGFICALVNKDLNEVVQMLTKQSKLPSKYIVTEVIQKSNHVLIMTDKDDSFGDTRTFAGKNTFYKFNNFLLNFNKQKNMTVVMINEIY